MPQWPLTWVHELVLTETVDPVVLTEIPAAAAGPAGVSASTAAAATGPERSSGFEVRMWTAFRRHGRRYIPCAAEVGERPCCHEASQRAPGPARTPAASGQVTASSGRPTPGPDQRPAPVVTVRSAEKPPQVPSGSIARIRTRWVTPASRPA
ncbi:phage tail tape-measure protein [Streptomyces sp. SAI-229]